MEARISTHQTILLLIVTVLGTAILLLPELIIHNARQDAWLSVILLMFFGLFNAGIYYLLTKQMGNKDLITFTRLVFGRVLTFVVMTILLIYFVFINGTIVREVAEVMKGIYLPRTPLWFFNCTIVLTAVILVSYGLEVIARSLEMTFYLFLISFLLTVLMLSKDLSFAALQPILGNGLAPVVKGLYPGTLFFSELFMILIFAPQITKKNKIPKILTGAVIVIGVVLTIVVCLAVMIFGPNLAANLTFPLLSAHRYVQAFGIIERLDPLFIFYWIGGGIFKVTIFLYAIVYLMKNFFELANYHVFIPIVGVGIIYISLYYFDNVVEVALFIEQSVPYFLAVQLLYPALLLLVSKLRGINCS